MHKLRLKENMKTIQKMRIQYETDRASLENRAITAEQKLQSQQEENQNFKQKINELQKTI